MSLRRRVVVAVVLSVAIWLVVVAASLLGVIPGGFMPLALFVLIGVACFVLFEWPARQARARRLSGLCPKCGYDLRGNVSGVCPECGSAGDST
jgi:hypothetical protein